MSFNEFSDNFLDELTKAQKEQEENKILKGETAEDFGFSEILEERQKKKAALRRRLLNYDLEDKNVDKLLKIIFRAEESMEKIKKAFNYSSKKVGSAEKMQKELIDVQIKMAKEFDEELLKMLKKKRNKNL